jgi:UDP-N-acetylmuramoylalanine--D-glutamate ligase
MSGVSSEVEPLDLERLDLEAFAGRPIAVLGLARSGIALARFLAARGATVTAYDLRAADELGEALAQLEGLPLQLRLGPEVDPAGVLAGQSLVCTSPSVSSRFPTTEPRLRAALSALEADGRVPVVSEVDLFLRLCPAPAVGVTGTKGKTTTSALTAAVLAQGDAPVLLGGNIGTPLVERLPGLTSRHRVVLELSELQLPTLSRGTDVAVYTHVTSDHLDRHGSVESYRAVKRRLAELLPPDGLLVLNDEDPVSRTYGEATSARVVTYRRDEPLPGGIGISDGWIVSRDVPQLSSAGSGGGAPGRAMTGPGGRIMPAAAVPLPGRHSLSNVCAAVAVGVAHGLAADAIRVAVERFEGVEHRLELVAESDGIRYVNDSQGTQPDAVIAALQSFPAPVVLICGGRSKDVPVDALARVVADRAAAVVVIGESGPALADAFRAEGASRIVRAGDMDEAVTLADALCRAALADVPASGAGAGAGVAPGTVLLSPAAASFDMYADYAARGRAFKAAVRALLARSRQGVERGAP